MEVAGCASSLTLNTNSFITIFILLGMCQGIAPISYIPMKDILKEIHLWNEPQIITEVDFQLTRLEEEISHIEVELIQPNILRAETNELPPLLSIGYGDIIDV